MAKRRSRGDGGLHYDKTRQRWIASVTVGWKPNGKRDVKKASGVTKTEAKNKLDDILRDLKDGLPAADGKLTVQGVIENWLTYGLVKQSATTVDKLRALSKKHLYPTLGRRKAVELSADEIDEVLLAKAKVLSTRTLQDLRAILVRSFNRAWKRDKVKRNVALLCEVPTGRPGRPSRSLDFDQAEAVLVAAERDNSTIGNYIVASLVSGARTEEARALIWRDVHLKGKPDAQPEPIPPTIDVWRSVRASGDTKTTKSRRSLVLAHRAVCALESQRKIQRKQKQEAGKNWRNTGIVFASETGTQLDAANVRRGFRRILKAAGLNPYAWCPRELRHSFVSLLSESGLSLDQIARLLGHSGTEVTEKVYRHQLRPVLQWGAEVMDDIFPSDAA
ncbi:tyrosine-type recombinase/integrase [Crossiella sp. SN42]|uniref:site-specific integrase n=1 Tax=Crossiella sp. SN42 TaxID=2944808 RepID=UPI00207CB221|nr:tyrosine-type recombinase/integrase [Crossiella sp. SN42]MCO1582175.1 tyrosine-type recombinase/integrase [Crossiella sp. SN42]